MIKTQLTYNLVHKWYTSENISVIGSAFLKNELLKEKNLSAYFKSANDEISFVEKLQKLSGHFSVVIKTTTSFLIAVDTIRTFPLFIHKNESDILLSDNIQENNPDWDEAEIVNFRKVYCTLENNTLLKDWQQLQAGEYAVISKDEASLNIKSYYHHMQQVSRQTDLPQKLSELETQLIDNAINYADNRTILIPLSGGYDSRYLLALLKEKNYAKIECYTYGRKDSYEALIAKNVCEKLNIKWHFIEYSDTLLQTFFSETWNSYSTLNHQYSSLPHEQDFFALQYLKENNLLSEDCVIMNGFCQDIHAGSFMEPVKNFDLQKFIFHKYQLKLSLPAYENSWNGYQEWLVKNRLSKFIINSVRVYEYFGLDFYLPFWQTDWINFWYSLPNELLLHQQFYNDYLFNGIFKKHKIDFKKPSHETTNKFYSLKRISKAILPGSITRILQLQNSKNHSKDVNNTLFLYEEIYKRLKDKPAEKDFRINNIHTLYLLQNLKEKHQL